MAEPSTESAMPGGDFRIAISVVAALGLAFFSVSAMPLLLGALTEQLSLTAARVGLLGTLELSAVAALAIGTAPLVASRSRVRLAMAGCVIASVGHCLSAAADTFAMLAVARIVAGTGMGIAAAAGQAAVAATREPDRVFGVFFAAATPLAALLLLALPYLAESHGYAGGYVVLALMALVAVPLVVWLPGAPGQAGAQTQSGSDPAPLRVAIPALLAVALVAATDFGVWSFLERIGSGIGVSPAGIGETLAAATLAGSVTAAGAAWLGTRFGRILPLVVSFTILVVSSILLGAATHAPSYVALVIIWAGSLFVAYTYVMGALAAADPSGRWSAAAAGARLTGGAIGPAAAGLAVAGGGYSGMGWIVAGWCGLGLLLAMPLLAYLSRRSAGG